jgi:hypothetical protein
MLMRTCEVHVKYLESVHIYVSLGWIKRVENRQYAVRVIYGLYAAGNNTIEHLCYYVPLTIARIQNASQSLRQSINIRE